MCPSAIVVARTRFQVHDYSFVPTVTALADRQPRIELVTRRGVLSAALATLRAFGSGEPGTPRGRTACSSTTTAVDAAAAHGLPSACVMRASGCALHRKRCPFALHSME